MAPAGHDDNGGEMASGVRGDRGRPGGASDLARVLGGYAEWVDRLPVVLYVAELDPGPRLVYVSPQAQDILGFPPEDWIGDRGQFAERVHPEDRERVVTVLRDVRVDESVSAGEFRMIASDGRTVWLHDRRVATQTEGGRVVVGMLTEVTDRKLAEQELAETERRFRDVVENVAAVFWIRSLADDEVLYVGPAYEEVWGRPVEALYASPHAWLDAIHPDDRQLVKDAAFTGAPDQYEAEYRIVRPDGSIRWIHDRAFAIRGGVDRPGVVTGMAEDVTDRYETEHALAEARERARAAFLNAPIGSAMVALSGPSAGQVVEVNPAFCAMLGYREEEIVGRAADSFMHPDELEGRTEWRAMWRGELDTYDAERRLVRSDDRVIWVRMRFSLIRDARAEPTYAVIQAEDITSAKRTEAQAAAVAELGQRALVASSLEEMMDDAVAAMRGALETTIVGVLEYVPDDGVFVPRAIAGVDEEIVAPAHDPVGGAGHLRHALESGEPSVIDDWRDDPQFEPSEFVRRLGARSTLSVPINGPRGTWGVLSTHSRELHSFSPDEVSFAQAVANVLGAAIQRRLAEEETQYRALHDPLTDLPNRTLLLDRLGLALDRAVRTGRRVAVLFMDLDHFKVINDSLGHETGDRLLCAFAPRLTEALRPSDTVARFGGDEFVVLCEDIHAEEDVVHLAERVLACLREPFAIGSHELFTSATIGLAIAREGDDADGLIRDADAAMYRAKARGRGRYELFDQAMRERVSERLKTENALRRALAGDALSLHFQPILALEDRSIVGAEALLRWHDPERGWIEPSRFIPIAEESGLIVAIGEWVLEQAMRTAVRWPEVRRGGGMPQLTVNLSARQVTHPAFSAQLKGALERSGLPPDRLSLEITESVLMEESGAPMEAIRGLKELGVALVLDDFGTGYSSLSYLHRLPIDVLKLDRSFIAPLRDDSHTTAAIVSGIVTMAEALGMTVVAEGVEHGEQVARLQALGCDYAQGFHFARPMPAAELEPLLRAGHIPAAEPGAG
jgi:diguanylate cyclase (GGDEF)-like protein/PAS domain S-box-containing protein